MHVSSELVSSDVNMVTLLMTVRSAQEVWFIGWGVHCCVDHTSWAHRQTDTHTHIHTPPNAAEVTPLSDDTSYYVVQSCRLITAFQEGLHDSVWSRGCRKETHTVDWGEWTRVERSNKYKQTKHYTIIWLCTLEHFLFPLLWAHLNLEPITLHRNHTARAVTTTRTSWP